MEIKSEEDVKKVLLATFAAIKKFEDLINEGYVFPDSGYECNCEYAGFTSDGVQYMGKYGDTSGIISKEVFVDWVIEQLKNKNKRKDEQKGSST